MDPIFDIFFKSYIFTIGFLFVFIAISRFTKPASLKLLKKLEEISKNKLFRKLFFIITGLAGLMGLIIGLAVSNFHIITGLLGLLGGILYFGLIFAVISMLYEYMKDDEV